LKFPPSPCEKITRGYFEDGSLGNNGASATQGIVVMLSKEGMSDNSDDTRGLAPRNEAYAWFHSRCGDGSHVTDDFDLAFGVVG
jgi:hypothetical protein